MTSRPECAVVGLGLIGAAATRHLAEAGVSVIGIGPLEPPDWTDHDGVFSSHYDSGRITRMLDGRFEWAELARRSIDSYASLSSRTGISFHHPVGVLDARSDHLQVEAIRSVAARLELAYEEGAKTVGPFYQLPPGLIVLHEPAPAGFIDPRAMLEAQQVAARAAGARLIHAEVDRVTVSAAGVELSVRNGETVSAKSILIAAGAYSRRFLPALSFTVKAEITILVEADRAHPGLPALLFEIDHDHIDSIYVVPPTQYPDGKRYLKLGANAVTDRYPADEAAMARWMGSDDIEADREVFEQVVRSLVPSLFPAVVKMKPCLVTYTAHGLPYVDRLEDRVFVAAGGNGQGAKSADAIGALAAGLVQEGAWTDDALGAEAFRAVTSDH